MMGIGVIGTAWSIGDMLRVAIRIAEIQDVRGFSVLLALHICT